MVNSNRTTRLTAAHRGHPTPWARSPLGDELGPRRIGQLTDVLGNPRKQDWPGLGAARLASIREHVLGLVSLHTLELKQFEQKKEPTEMVVNGQYSNCKQGTHRNCCQWSAI